MSEHAYLALMLDAPFMSWGYASRFQRRTTALHPTRSGIAGMICAALGAGKGTEAERDWLERLEDVRFTALQIPRQPADSPAPLDIRRLEDYHTVSGTRRANGAISKDAVLSHRQYLLDARFGMMLAGPRATLVDIANALRNPRWGIWFGRKNCIPAAPVVRGDVVASTAEAMAALGMDGRRPEEFSRVEEVDSFADGSDTLMDAPVNFQTRAFKPRRILQQSGSKGG